MQKQPMSVIKNCLQIKSYLDQNMNKLNKHLDLPSLIIMEQKNQLKVVKRKYKA